MCAAEGIALVMYRRKEKYIHFLSLSSKDTNNTICG
jgi:hypothetical protein